MAFRNTKVVDGCDLEGTAWQVTYYTDSTKALHNLLLLNNLEHVINNFHGLAFIEQNIHTIADTLGLQSYEIFKLHQGRFYISTQEREENMGAPPTLKHFRFFIKSSCHQIYIIKNVEKVQKCLDCGRFYKVVHTCNVRRRHFFFHHVNGQTCDWWKEISFTPIGSPPITQRLFITYDVETYTWHGHCGKQLIPFMLVFSITGNETMKTEAAKIALNQQWSLWENNAQEVIFYCLNPQKRFIGHKFKAFRNELQRVFTSILWQSFLKENNHLLEKIKESHHIVTVDEITPAMLKNVQITGQPKFMEIYVIGHNINGFDEIVLAAQVIQNKTEVCSAFTIRRNFMPRNGKILFNDITFGLPNPSYRTRKDYALWEEGACDETDFKHQYVKFMVRDTFALTHTSLRNAAKAYNLPVEKGCCPYSAVNEFYMTGSYLTDEDHFPHQKYWKNLQEYEENKSIWKQSSQPYDLIQQTLQYCVQDVKVTSQLVQKLLESYKHFICQEVKMPLANFNILQRPTISSNSHAIFRQILYRQSKPEKNTLGHSVLAPSHEMYEYIRQSIRGGRCYPTYIGVLTKKIYVYDICGMYASALTHPFPSGNPLPPYDRNLAIIQWQSNLDKSKKIDYFSKHLLPGIFTIDADPPADIFLDTLPPFCSKKGGRLVWTNESLRGEVCTSIDMITLHNRGWKVKIIPDPRCTIFPEWKCLCQEYVQLNIRAKEKADKEKNQTVRSIAKLLSNALYGSFATKLDNKKIVFGDELDENAKEIATGKMSIKATSFIETDDFSAEILPEFTVTYEPWQQNAHTSAHENSNEENEDSQPLNSTPNHAPNTTVNYKPITLLDADDEELCLHTLEKNSDIIENNRYPSQIASFVLAWTRAFISEWANFLFEEDYGTPIEERSLKAVYGDTDSLFLTEEGRELMESKGKKRLKKSGGSLIFNPAEPDITWLVECETQCHYCGADAYSSESIFLAPKLYALKNTLCDVCHKEGPGKLRAKGHATDSLDYNTLVSCYYSDHQQGTEKYHTSRLTLKRTLASAQEQAHPFTVTETTLTRTLRPWKDMTLVKIDQQRLMPYSNKCPNPRNKEMCLMELPWNM